MIKRLIIWPPRRGQMRVSINLMIKSFLVTMLIDSALTLLGPLNSTVPDAATVVHGAGQTTHNAYGEF
jgi:hypothetical protein